MSYIEKCTKFLNDEYKAQEKENERILSLKDSEQFDEEECLTKVTISSTDDEFVHDITFPKQKTKIREEKNVVIYDMKTKQCVTEATIQKLKVIQGNGKISARVKPGTYLLVSKMDFKPYSIINSLKKISKNGTSDLVQKLLDRESHDLVYAKNTTENIIKSVLNMQSEYLIIQGPPGTGKTYTGSKIIAALLAKGKKIGITSHSHKAINNLCESIDPKINFKGYKVCSDSAKSVLHRKFSNGVSGVDEVTRDFQVVAGTCFAFCKMEHTELDYLIVDEASQLKFSYILSAMRKFKNVIFLGDQQQLQSFSILEGVDQPGSESVLDYLIPEINGKKQVVSSGQGYFLAKTYRMEPGIANINSVLFYDNQLKAVKTEYKSGVQIVWDNHKGDEKYSTEECEATLKIYKELRKNKVLPKDIMIMAPYNAQAGLLREFIPDEKTQIGTVDLFQGREAKYVILSLTYGGVNKESLEFVTDKHRLNVAISRAKDGVYIIASEKLKTSKKVSSEFQTLIKMVC